MEDESRRILRANAPNLQLVYPKTDEERGGEKANEGGVQTRGKEDGILKHT